MPKSSPSKRRVNAPAVQRCISRLNRARTLGRTGPCADAVIQAGIAHVVVAMEDPNPRVQGQGLAGLRAAGIRVELAPEAEQRARKLNEAFVHYMTTGQAAGATESSRDARR
jgi:hypothetical protein